MIRRPRKSPLFPSPPLSRSPAVFLVRRDQGAGGGLLACDAQAPTGGSGIDRKSTRLNSSHSQISYAVFCLKKKKKLRISLTALAWTHENVTHVSRRR